MIPTETIEQLVQLQGYMPRDEGAMLYLIARACTGQIVEIGSFLGKSTAFLAAGLHDRNEAGNRKIIAVDHHRGSPEHQQGQPYYIKDFENKQGQIDTFPLFEKNLRSVKLWHYVDPRVASSEDAAGRYEGHPVHFLFIDADHNEPAVWRDVNAWNRFVPDGGLLGLHDIGTWPGPTAVANELIQSNRYRHVCLSGSLVLLRKTNGTTNP